MIKKKSTTIHIIIFFLFQAVSSRYAFPSDIPFYEIELSRIN